MRYPGVYSSGMFARCRPTWGLQLLLVLFRCLMLVGFYPWVVCALSFVSVVISVSGPFCCVRVLVFHLGGCVRFTSLVSSLAVR